jgi:phosphoribosylamine--glycine ligase
MRFTIVGAGLREHALARRLVQEGNTVTVILTRANPGLEGLADRVLRIEGNWDAVISACSEADSDCVVVQTDLLLEAGFSERLARRTVSPIFGANRHMTLLEADKAYAQRVVRNLCPRFSNHPTEISDVEELLSFLDEVEYPAILRSVRPLTLPSPVVLDARDRAPMNDLRRALDRAPLLGERYLLGRPFTIHVLGDGERVAFAPPMWSYPFRLRGESGVKTSGMGSVTSPGQALPYLSSSECEEVEDDLRKLFEALATKGIHLRGACAVEFMKSEERVYFVEMDCRLGDPETINLVGLLRSPLNDLLCGSACGQMPIPEFSRDGSASVSLVAPAYSGPPDADRLFTPDFEGMVQSGLGLDYGNLISVGSGRWRVGRSRAAALSCVSSSPSEIEGAVRSIADLDLGGLEYRADIGSDLRCDELPRVQVCP